MDVTRLRFLLAAFVVMAGTDAMAVEEPKYEVVDMRMGFEMRRYAPYLVAETRVTGTWGKVGGEASGILRDYLSGANARGESIERTAPVIQAPEPAGATARAAAIPGADDSPRTYTFAFVMPAKYSMQTLPRPNDARVTLREVPARLVAARRFTGVWSPENLQQNQYVLLESIELAGQKAVGIPVFARYDSGLTPWFMRRNEVQVELSVQAAEAQR